ncbi:MAG: zinc ribbon domain-containing protein [Anaerolineae bacterium]|nr:zinc ribbon domain-containing protein [Anaerolineae bacterium]
MDDQTLNDLVLFSVTALGAGLSALWFGLTLWTWQDMRARSRDPLAQIAATLLVFALPAFGIMVYLLLRPRETLADAYERSLEEEALLQEIEEKPHCPGCARGVKHAWQVCPFCHTRLKRVCHHCGYLLELNWNLCPACATPQLSQASADQLEVQSSVPTGRPSNRRSIMRQIEEDQSPYERSDLEYMDE